MDMDIIPQPSDAEILFDVNLIETEQHAGPQPTPQEQEPEPQPKPQEPHPIVKKVDPCVAMGALKQIVPPPQTADEAFDAEPPKDSPADAQQKRYDAYRAYSRDPAQAAMNNIQPPTDDECELFAPVLLKELGIVPHDAADLVQEDIEPPRWIIRDFLALHMRGDLFGKSKTRKSFLAQQLALCVATGQDFLSLKVPNPVRVAYFNLELLEWFEQERIAKQTSWFGDVPRRQLFVYNLRGRAACLRDCADALARQLKSLGVELAIIDPRYKILRPGEDENSSQGLRGVLEFRDALAEVCAVLVVGHDPKGDVAGKSIADRGAGSYAAGADCDFSLALSPHEQEGLIVLSMLSRYRESPPDVTIGFNPESLVFRVLADIPAVKQGKPQQRRTQCEQAAASALKEKQMFDALVEIVSGDELKSVSQVEDEMRKRGFSRNPVKEQIRLACDNGTIEKQVELDSNGRKRHGKTYLCRPEAAAAYREKFERLAI